MKKADIETMREWVRSGMPIDESIQDYVEESVYETEDSYRDKLERMSEYMMGH